MTYHRKHVRLPSPLASAGLRQLAGLVEAGSSADIVGYDEGTLKRLAARGEPGALQHWREVEAAVRWIRRYL